MKKRFFNWVGESEKAKTFSQHSFQTKIEILSGIPRVLVSRLAYNKMWHYVDLATKEVSWLGIVVEQGNNFLVEDVFLLKQEVSHTETEITTDGLAELGQEILAKPNGMEIWNNVRFWGHSHVNMGTSPSATDEGQMEVFQETGHPFFIRGILNKQGQMEFTIFLYSAGIKIIDSEWSISEPVDESIREEIEKEFKERVSEQVYVVPAFSRNYDYSHKQFNEANNNPINKIKKRGDRK